MAEARKVERWIAFGGDQADLFEQLVRGIDNLSVAMREIAEAIKSRD